MAIQPGVRLLHNYNEGSLIAFEKKIKVWPVTTTWTVKTKINTAQIMELGINLSLAKANAKNDDTCYKYLASGLVVTTICMLLGIFIYK